ncbi:hypothetical protein ACFLQY_01325 [Verrucomicrobiota bacterium]
MYHSGTHPARQPHHFHLPHFHLYTLRTSHVIILLLTLTLLALAGVLIYMAISSMPADIEFRPIYFPGPLVFK